jgi:periplasmic protein TonB
MFEDSLVESTGRIRTRSKWFAIGSFLLQAALLAVLILIPYLYPASLPKQALTMLLVAPPPPPMRAAVLTEHAVAAHAAAPMLLTVLTAPSAIPRHPAMIADGDAVPGAMDLGTDKGGAGVISSLPGMGPAPPPPVVAKPRQGPVRVSNGVAEGWLVAPIRPEYPAIARAAHVQGTVVVEAIISKQGTVENAHVVSGSPMLAQAALSAVGRARYQPYKLNGEPVEVETTINIIFNLSQ